MRANNQRPPHLRRAQRPPRQQQPSDRKPPQNNIHNQTSTHHEQQQESMELNNLKQQTKQHKQKSSKIMSVSAAALTPHTRIYVLLSWGSYLRYRHHPRRYRPIPTDENYLPNTHPIVTSLFLQTLSPTIYIYIYIYSWPTSISPMSCA